ncbi:beta-lactamase-like protein [Podospora aff. communis PSN243]|uniref:Beta-lactamase-like protein n=1 Tax=Podospora aff. communis PSN243 TaxID=3040156 RepID=A0AAV9GIT5_9PEZI|nr:beta-lactamase-like protein [Podospora aff. communis PSN243]
MKDLAIILLGLTVPALARNLFDVPPGATAKVKIIDSTVRLGGLSDTTFVTPKLEGFDVLPTLPVWSFLIESSTGRKAVFDLAVPPDPASSYSPAVLEQIEGFNAELRIEKHVADILKDGGVKLAEVESVIWSHYHFDHIGDIATFPLTTEIVVGPGFSDAYLPGYPTNPNSTLLDRYFVNRTLREIDFTTSSLKAGTFLAHDFFGDGSFFLLDTPGHTTGHLGGLARTTTNPDTFIFMGGDLCHHSAILRPSPERPIPKDLHIHLHDIPASHSRVYQCPGAVTKEEFEHLNIKRSRRADEPFFDPVLVENFTQAVDTIRRTQTADVSDNVWFVSAHDPHIIGTADFFPKEANHWKKKGWAEKVYWTFLKDLLPAVEVDREDGEA